MIDRRGWCWGGLVLEERLRETLREAGPKPKGSALRATPQIKGAHDEEEVNRIVAEGMRRLHLTIEDLRNTPGSEPRKVAIVWAADQRTTVRRS